MIKRRLTENILKLYKHFPVISILGPRQSGKTTLAKELRKQIARKSIMLDMENPDDYLKMDNAGIYLRSFIEYTVIIDEIQKRPELFQLLRVLVDENRKAGRFIILGSANPGIIKGASESLAGRVAFIELNPFDYVEINDKYNLKHHWFYGGFPRSLLNRNRPFSLKWLDDFITTYIERDLPEFGLVTSSQNLRRFWTMMANSQGGIFNASLFAKSLGISHPTVTRYLDFLEGSFMARKLYPYFTNIKKRLVKSPKVYIRDPGILHRLLRINNYRELIGNLIAGPSWEGYVIEQVNNLKNDNIEIYFYRTKDGTECDMIFTKSLMPVACAEIKFTSTPNISKSLKITMDDLKIEKGFIITPFTDDYPLSKKVKVCNFTVFISKYLSEIK